MHQHDERPGADVVHTPREADEQDRGYMVNDLLFKVLQRQKDVKRCEKILGWCNYSRNNRVCAHANMCKSCLIGKRLSHCAEGTQCAFLARFSLLRSASVS